MSSECCICLEKIDEGVIDVWLCTNCNIEVHRKCKNEWERYNEGKYTCPHCRNEENTTIEVFNVIDNMEMNIFEPVIIENRNNRIPNTIYYCLYFKLSAIIMAGICCGLIVFGFMYFVFTSYHYRIYNYNYTIVR